MTIYVHLSTFLITTERMERLDI